ncbi:hypothetical protein K2X33_10500, partial [bacterium]|nr:hypothetical protein [bacterium]
MTLSFSEKPFRFATLVALVAVVLGLLQTYTSIHFIQEARVPGSALPFLLAAFFSLILPLVFWGVRPRDRAVGRVVFPLVGGLLLQILTEFVFAKLFFSTAVFFVAPPYQAF